MDQDFLDCSLSLLAVSEFVSELPCISCNTYSFQMSKRLCPSACIAVWIALLYGNDRLINP